MSANLLFERIDRPALESVFAHRAEVSYWRGRLTRTEYLERTRRIFVSHPFGRERVRVFGLRDGAAGEWVSSMDVLDVDFQLAHETAPRRLPLITSLVTPTAHRKRGLAAKLVERFHEAEGASLFFLYSDIAPAFYERLGYAASELVELLASARRRSGVGGTRAEERLISTSEAVRLARVECADRLSSGEGEAVCLPDELFLDWHLERYRFFAELRGRTLPEELCWALDHGGDHPHVLCAAPDFPELQLDALWLRGDCARCVEFAAARAAELGLERLRYWASPRAGQPPGAVVSEHGCVPMLRAAGGAPIPRLVTPKLCTWF